MDATPDELAKVFRALRHPIRVRILTALASPGRTSSPRELAEEFGESLGVVSYHVRELHKVKMLQLARKVARRGAVEHYYRLSPGGWSLYGVACEVAELIRPGRHLRPRQIRR